MTTEKEDHDHNQAFIDTYLGLLARLSEGTSALCEDAFAMVKAHDPRLIDVGIKLCRSADNTTVAARQVMLIFQSYLREMNASPELDALIIRLDESVKMTVSFQESLTDAIRRARGRKKAMLH